MKEIIFGAILGIVITLLLVFSFGIATAHFTGSDSETPEGNTWEMSCMDIAYEDMDQNGDGLCDICGMNIEHCEEMHGHMHSKGYEAMYEMMHEDSVAGAMPCHMGG